MHGTSRVREPSLFCWSTARPRPTCLWWMTPGLPVPLASSTNAALRAGTSVRARTMAYPMRWVKLTLAPVVRASWLLRICRFTSRRRAGTVRTLVAVGTPRLASMLATMRLAAPLRRTASSAPESTAGGAASRVAGGGGAPGGGGAGGGGGAEPSGGGGGRAGGGGGGRRSRHGGLHWNYLRCRKGGSPVICEK